MQEFVLTNELFVESYSGILSSEQLQSLLSTREKWGWISYIIPFLFIPIKVLFTSAALLVGLVLSNIEIEYKQLYKIVLSSEIVFILAMLVQLVGLSFFAIPQTVNDINTFAPFTLAFMLNLNSFPTWIHPLFYGISVYEVLYILLLTYLLSDTKHSFKHYFLPILVTYFVWFVFIYTLIIYLSLQLNPS